MLGFCSGPTFPTSYSLKSHTGRRTKPQQMKSSRFCLAAETLGNNEDLLKQLLLHLPTQSLVRFKSVSKLWLSIISDPTFQDSHTVRNPNPKLSSIILSRAPTPTPNPLFISLFNNNNNGSPLDFVGDPQGIKILQSCNGLLMCCSSLKTSRKFYVVNPATKHCSELALPPEINPERISSIVLALDPSKSLYYKVVLCIFRPRNTRVQTNSDVQIYSSRTRTWSLSKTEAMWLMSTDCILSGVYCNGAINWLSRFYWLLYFRVDEEVWGVVEDFRGGSGSFTSLVKQCMCLGESGGNLHLISRRDGNKFDVLEMGKDYSGWFVKYRIDDLVFERVLFPQVFRDYHPFMFIDVEVESEEESASLLVHVADKVVSYNLKDKSIKKLCHLTTVSRIEWRDAYCYRATLARV